MVRSIAAGGGLERDALIRLLARVHMRLARQVNQTNGETRRRRGQRQRVIELSPPPALFRRERATAVMVHVVLSPKAPVRPDEVETPRACARPGGSARSRHTGAHRLGNTEKIMQRKTGMHV